MQVLKTDGTIGCKWKYPIVIMVFSGDIVPLILLTSQDHHMPKMEIIISILILEK